MEVYSLQHEKFCTGVSHLRGFLLAKCHLLGVVSLSSKFLNVYDFGMKMHAHLSTEGQGNGNALYVVEKSGSERGNDTVSLSKTGEY